MEYDIIIKNGRILDGTGNPWFLADIAINEGKIVKIKRNIKEDSREEFDASKLIVCPGFIDPHSHSDLTLIFDNKMESFVRQGITTNIVGNCGDGLAPVNPNKLEEFKKTIEYGAPEGVKIEITWSSYHEYLNEMSRIGSSINFAFLVGFGTIRSMLGPGFEDRPPTKDEMESMKGGIAEAMEAGAFGMSTGLIYTPQVYSKTKEIIELAKVVAKYGGLYFSHIRGEGDTVMDAIKEVIEIVDKSGCVGGQIAHHKIATKKLWGASKDTLHLMEDANMRELNITCDQYPYNRGMTSLITVLPPWSHIGGVEKTLERLRDPDTKERIKMDILQGIEGWENMIADAGFENIYISLIKSEKWMEISGKNLIEITKIKKKKDEWETLFELLSDDNAETMITIEMMNEKDITQIMAGRYTMIGTDGWGVSPTGILSHGTPHPRFYGTYPRVLGRYVREKKILRLEEAVRKMTSFPAQKLGLFDRGMIREGMWADITIFDSENVIDVATYEKPHQFSKGISYVIVNGIIVVKNEEQNDKLPGKILRMHK